MIFQTLYSFQFGNFRKTQNSWFCVAGQLGVQQDYALAEPWHTLHWRVPMSYPV